MAGYFQDSGLEMPSFWRGTLGFVTREAPELLPREVPLSQVCVCVCVCLHSIVENSSTFDIETSCTDPLPPIGMGNLADEGISAKQPSREIAYPLIPFDLCRLGGTGCWGAAQGLEPRS